MNFVKRLKIIKLLLIKNLKIRFHNKLSFVLLFLIPIIFTLFIFFVFKESHYIYKSYKNIEDHKAINKIKLKEILTSPESVFQNITILTFERYGNETRVENMNIVYTPINFYAKILMKNFEDVINKRLMVNKFSAIGVESETEFNSLLKKSIIGDDSQFSYGIKFKFDGYNDLTNDVPKHLKYEISVLNRPIYNIDRYRDVNSQYETFKQTNEYIEQGFCQIQTAIDLAHIYVASNYSDLDKFNILMQKMPIPQRYHWESSSFISRRNLSLVLILIMKISLLVMLPVVVKRIVEEKATRITDYLVLLGVGRIEIWVTVIIDSLAILGLQSVIIALILCIPSQKFTNESISVSYSILDRIDFSLLITFIFVFLIQSILFACLISVFFKSPNIAVIATILEWILTSVITLSLMGYMFSGQRGNIKLQLWGKQSLSCLIPNFSLFWFIWIANGLCSNAEWGASWTHISDAGYLTDDMTLGHVLTIILLSYPLYGLLIWYLSSVIPTQHLIAKPFYFPLLNIYNFYIKKVSKNSYQSMFDRENYSILVKNLSKKYKSKLGLESEYVLKNINLKIKDKSITVILGPNGSGKTTLINIIIGKYL
jgi:ABC-type multidrug transport system fused ATPase/permease subunit